MAILGGTVVEIVLNLNTAGPVLWRAAPAGYVYSRGLYFDPRIFILGGQPIIRPAAGHDRSTHPLWSYGGCMSTTNPTTSGRRWWVLGKRISQRTRWVRDEAFYRAGQWCWFGGSSAGTSWHRSPWLSWDSSISSLFSPNSSHPMIRRSVSRILVRCRPVRCISSMRGTLSCAVHLCPQADDPVTLRPIYKEDTSLLYPISLFVPGDEYKLWGLIPGNIHLFGVRTDPDTFVPLFLLGSDTLGHDMLSRIFFGARISLTVGPPGVLLAFFIGLVLGALQVSSVGWRMRSSCDLLMCSWHYPPFHCGCPWRLPYRKTGRS